MDDLIKRQDAIRAVTTRDGCGRCEKAIKNIPSAQQWIHAHNIFPGENGKYLVTGKHGTVNVLKYEDGRWYGGAKPIAWMRMPEPYKEAD